MSNTDDYTPDPATIAASMDVWRKVREHVADEDQAAEITITGILAMDREAGSKEAAQLMRGIADLGERPKATLAQMIKALRAAADEWEKPGDV